MVVVEVCLIVNGFLHRRATGCVAWEEAASPIPPFAPELIRRHVPRSWQVRAANVPFRRQNASIISSMCKDRPGKTLGRRRSDSLECRRIQLPLFCSTWVSRVPNGVVTCMIPGMHTYYPHVRQFNRMDHLL